ncbi:MAG: hypothetical protein HPY54_08750 [Chthonomonadetes bacterium]|nr:hypothetical protein [Chthonomonadetes bacterium]
MQSTKAAIFKWSKQIARVPAMMLLITLFAAAMCMPQSFPPDLIWYQPVLDARSVAYTRDASGEELIAVPSRYGTVSLYRRGDGVRVKVIAAHSDRVNTVAFSADGSLLATGSDDTTVKIWRVQDRGLSVTPVHTLQGHSSWVNAVAFSQNGQYLASASRDGTVRVWNVASGETVRSIADGNPVTSVAFSPDGQLLATGSEGTTLVKIWRLNDGSLVRTLSGHTLAVQSVAFSPDGQYLASGSADRTVRVWQVDSGDSLHTLSGHTLAVQSVAFSPDGQYVASGSADNTVHVWRVNDGSLVRTLSGHTLAVQSVAFSPDGQYLASASADQSVRVWNASSGALAQRFSMDEVLSVATSPDGALVASGGKDGVVHFWEQPSGAQTGSELSADDWILSIAISPDGQRTSASTRNASVYLWPGNALPSLHGNWVHSVAFSSDNRLLASAGRDGQVVIWDVAARSQRLTLNVGSPIYQVAFGPDLMYETLIATAGADGSIRIWDANTGTGRGTITTGHGKANTLAFGPYNRYLVAGFSDGYVLLKDRVRDTTREIHAHDGEVFSVVFSPDGGLVVSAGADNTLKCWSIQDGELTFLKTLGGTLMPSASRSVSFTPDGIFMVAGGEDGVTLWRVREAQFNAAPSIPTVISPESGAIVPPQPIFQLRASDANNDQVKFALELVQGEEVKRYETALTDSGRTLTYTLPEELASGEWTWKVRAIDARGSAGDWSNTRTFTVNRAPAVAEVLEPEDNSIVSPTPTLRLRASDAEGDQVRFRIRLVQGESEQSVETGLTDSGRSLLFTLPTELASGVWQYQVRAIDAKGSEGEWSTVRTFTVNRVAQSVEILAPSDGSVVSPAPTFQLRASDAEGDQVKFALELVQGEEVKRYETALTDSGRTLTYTLPEELASGEWTWKVRAIDARGSAGDWSNTRTFTVASEVPVGLPATLNGWGTGLNLGNATKRDVGLADVKMYKWDATSKQYIEVSADDPILVGQGYWIRPGTQMRLAIAGAPVASPFSIPLKAGWNYISNPFLRAVPWNAESVQVRRGGEVRDLMQATQSGWIFGYAWGWQPNPQHPAGGEYFPVYTTAGLPGIQNSLAPWQGYWVYAHVDCELILNLSSRQVVVSGRSGNTSSSTWGIQLRLSNGEHNAWAIIGAQREGTGTAIALPPSPPVTVPAPTMVILRDGVPLAVDLRVHNRSVQPWEISVNVPAGQHERATLYWQGAYTVPRDVNLVLVDLQTGERKFLRTSSSHTFAVSRQGGEYRFRIETVPDGGILRISSVRVSGGRGTGGRYTISYAVNTVAQVEVNILTSAGKIARRVASDITRSAGIQQVSWDGRDGNGIALPAGVYLAEIKATGSDGQVVRSTVPLVLTR